MSPVRRRRSRTRRSARSNLRELADRLGVLSEYVGQTGRVVRSSDAQRQALLAVMGFDAPSEAAAAGWLDALDHETRTTIVDPVRVVPRGSRDATRVRVRMPEGVSRAELEVTLTEESGHVWRVTHTIRGSSAVAQLPAQPPLGYHTIDVVVRTGAGDHHAQQSLIVAPTACVSVKSVLGGRKAMGVVTNLYAQRREADWGVGDLTTLTQIVEWGAARGAAFVGVNPLHALFNRGMDVSPYSPVSRLFRNHIYIDVEQVPEYAQWRQTHDAERILAEAAALREHAHVHYDAVIAQKERVLEQLHAIFRAGTGESGAQRRREYGDYLRDGDPELTRFATWMAIAASASMPDWRQWPASMQDPESESVAAFRDAHMERVDFHRWLQFETSRQLGECAARAHVLGMPIGVYQDLAIGTSRGGSDTWTYPHLFVTDASVGAPPDPYSAYGQNWGLPPVDPRALYQQRYRYWIELLRRAFQHAGALRIDHVMGLFRQFWIPDGMTGKQGTYVRYPASDLLGILALESVRHNAIVVGEDLGTVPKEVPPALRKWNILSSRVLYFERDDRGFRPASRYIEQSLATMNTHDMPPLAGFWKERDIELRAQVGLLPTAAQVRRARRNRVKDKASLLGLVGLDEPSRSEETRFPRVLAGAVHDFLCDSPASLVGVSMDDLTGEVDPVNVPGVGQDKYPSWRRRSSMTIEAMAWSAEVDDTIGCRRRRTGDVIPSRDSDEESALPTTKVQIPRSARDDI